MSAGFVDKFWAKREYRWLRSCSGNLIGGNLI